MSQYQKTDSQQYRENDGRSVIQEQPTIHQQTCDSPAVLGAFKFS